MTKHLGALALFSLVALSACVAPRTIPSQRPSVAERFAESRPVVIAHRGCWREGPENSLKAFRACERLGVDVLEIDLRETRDGEIVLLHDDTLDRTTNLTGPLKTYALRDLEAARLRKGWGGPGQALTNERIVTFEQALDATRASGIFLFLDIKEPLHDKAFAIVERLGDERRVLFSLNRNFEPGIWTARFLGRAAVMPKLTQYRDGECRIEDPAEDLERYGAVERAAYEVVFCDEAFLRRVAARPAGNRALWVNTLGPKMAAGRSEDEGLADAERLWGSLLQAGVTAIQTDHPAELIAFLKARGLRK